MIFQFFRRTRDDPSIASLYGTIVAQARAKALYQRFGVPDTVNGRLEMILLHVILLLRRLNEEPDGAPWGQAVLFGSLGLRERQRCGLAQPDFEWC